MKRLSFAIAMVVLMAALSFLLFNFVLYQEDFAGSVYEKGVPLAISGFVLALAPFLSQFVSGKKDRFRFNTLPDQIVRFETYTLPWYILLIYGTFLVFAAGGIAIFIIWLIGLGTGFFLTQAILILETIFVSLAVYFASAWAGSRVDRRPFLTAIGIVLAYSLLSTLVEFALGSGFALIPLVARLALFLVIALFGAWRGVRARPTRYIQYLLDLLPSDELPVLLERVYMEANRLSKDPAWIEPGEVVEDDQDIYGTRAQIMESPTGNTRS